MCMKIHFHVTVAFILGGFIYCIIITVDLFIVIALGVNGPVAKSHSLHMRRAFKKVAACGAFQIHHL